MLGHSPEHLETAVTKQSSSFQGTYILEGHQAFKKHKLKNNINNTIAPLCAHGCVYTCMCVYIIFRSQDWRSNMCEGLFQLPLLIFLYCLLAQLT